MASSNQFGNLPATVKQRMQEIWRSPSAVSAIASLGFHGFLFLALPLLPYAAITAREPEIQEPVEMVELTPEEQKRLPEFSTLPPIELPQINDPPKPPEDSDLFSFSDLPKPSVNSVSPSSDSLFTSPLPIFIPPAPPAPLPSFSIQIPTAPAPVPQPAPSVPEAASPQPSPTATAETPAETPAVAVEPAPASPQPEQPEESEVAAAPSPEPRSQEQIRAELLARQQELRELYTYNPSGTGVEDANTSFLGWFNETMGREYATGDSKPNQQEVVSEYPKLACPLKQSRNAVVGVAVDAENQIVSEPKILQSSGYRLFNQEALKVAESHTFENSSGDKQVYLLRVKFEYSEDVCPPGFSPLNQPSDEDTVG